MNVKESLEILRTRFEQKNIVFVSGNVYDKYLSYENDENQKLKRELISLHQIIANIAKENGYKTVNYFRDGTPVKNLLNPSKNQDESIISPLDFLENAIAEIEDKEQERKVYIFDSSDIFFNNGSSNIPFEEVIRKMISTIVAKEQKEATNIAYIQNNSKIVFIGRDHGNVSNLIFNKNNELANVNISYPDIDERSDLLSLFAKMIGTTDDKDVRNRTSKAHKEAIAITAGMSYKEILQLGRIQKGLNKTFKELYNLSRFNKVKSQWEKLDFNRVKNVEDFLSKYVMGQDFAIKSVARTLKASLIGLNGAMSGDNNYKPKGILFFAGPTGVGKTELAKTLARFVFEDETRMVRFDMSEFSQEHSDQRLIGAPPGYVGYDSGGELTNAVRDEPQSILLFDEIEKAHPKILDKFLQILEDGRLTSAKGELIDFSETFIIFTSNIGAKGTSPDNDDESNRKGFINGVKTYFKNELKRPEILNRIGEQNIIPFNYITNKKILKLIFRSKVDRLLNSIKQKHNIIINIDEDEDDLFDIVLDKYNSSNGGRGLIAAIEVTLQTAIVDYLFLEHSLLKTKKDASSEFIHLQIIIHKKDISFEKMK